MSSDRRDFLKFLFTGSALGVGLSPFEILLKSAVLRTSNQAHAQTIQNKFYFNLTFPGAPNRLPYDLFLDPYGTGSNIQPSLGVANCFGSTNGSSIYDKPDYQSFRISKHNILAPWMWGQKMPTSDGFKFIHELMDNTIIIQGVRTASPGHSLSMTRYEESDNLTVAGSLADSSYSPFNAVDMDSDYSFKSKKGSFVTPVNNSIDYNIISELMSNFKNDRIRNFNNYNDTISKSFNTALDNLNYDSGLKSPSSLNLKKTYLGALDLMTSTIQDFSTVWQTSLNKYKGVLEQASLDQTQFSGFLDKPIGVAQDSRTKTYAIGDDEKLCLNEDLRSMLNKDSCIRMAAGFAVAEFIANTKYASAVNFSVYEPRVNIQDTASGPASSRGITHDQHTVGVMVSTLTNAILFRSLSSCLYEFKKFLKTQSVGYNFDNTLIRMNGEFARSVRSDGTGTDHGWQSSNCMIFSGMIDKPAIVGRIYKDGFSHGLHGMDNSGSWGVGAPITINGITDTLTQGHIISTVSALLGIPTPAKNSPPLFRIRNSKAEIISEDLKLKVIV